MTRPPAGPPASRRRTRRTLVTLAGAVVAALVLWRLRPGEPAPKPSSGPDKPAD